jgi:methionyl-tRNA formyltransferase
MKIVFMGTPEFAVPSLKKIIDSNYEIPFVVTVPDKEKGRGLKKQFSDVKITALEHGLKVLQPDNLNDEIFLKELAEANPDLIIIIAFRMLPKEVYTLPKFGSVNLHASYLPKYRGAAPINRAIINGEKETGLTTFFLKDKADTGNIILQEKVEITDEDNAGTLHDKLSVLGSELILKTIKLIESGEYKLTEQDDSLATKAPKIFKEDCLINWNRPAIEIHNLIRGLSPYPTAFTHMNNKICKIYKSRVLNAEVSSQNSEVRSENSFEFGKIVLDNKKIYVQTADDLLEILELQLEGKKRIPSGEFLNGIDKVLLQKFSSVVGDVPKNGT